MIRAFGKGYVRGFLIVLLILVPGYIIQHVTISAADKRDRPAKCVPASEWRLGDPGRPCVRIGRVYEDGSAVVYQEHANGNASSRMRSSKSG